MTTRSMFLPVMRCARLRCTSQFVGVGKFCPPCAVRMERHAALMRDIKSGKRASKRDVTEHKRASIRKRLGVT